MCNLPGSVCSQFSSVQDTLDWVKRGNTIVDPHSRDWMKQVKRLNVVIGLYSLQPGGTEFQMTLLANELRKRGHSITFYCVEPTTDSVMLNQYPPFPTRISYPTLPSTITSIPARRRLTHRVLSTLKSYLLLSRQWREWLLIDKPDVVIGALSFPQLIFNLVSPVPVIGRRGFNWSEVLNIPSYAKAYSHLRLISPFIRYRTHTLVCNAYHVQSSMITHEHWHIDKTTIIHNGWPEYPQRRLTSLRTIYAGRDRTEKSYTIPGVERLTTVPVWSDVGIYVHPTLAEGCSNSIGMAMAHGIPVIAMRTPGNEELLGTNYQALVGSEGSIRHWINFLQTSASLREYLGSICRSIVRTHYSLKVMVDRWETLLYDTCHAYSR